MKREQQQVKKYSPVSNDFVKLEFRVQNQQAVKNRQCVRYANNPVMRKFRPVEEFPGQQPDHYGTGYFQLFTNAQFTTSLICIHIRLYIYSLYI